MSESLPSAERDAGLRVLVACEFSGTVRDAFLRAGHAHRAPKHRADRNEDSCSLVCEGGWAGGVPCSYYAGRRRAGVAA